MAKDGGPFDHRREVREIVVGAKPKTFRDLPYEVIDEFRQGNHDAYKDIYDFYNASVRRFLSSFRMADDLLEDIAQEVFITLWERRENVKPEKRVD